LTVKQLETISSTKMWKALTDRNIRRKLTFKHPIHQWTVIEGDKRGRSLDSLPIWVDSETNFPAIGIYAVEFIIGTKKS
jgi:FAD synthase